MDMESAEELTAQLRDMPMEAELGVSSFEKRVAVVSQPPEY